MNVKHKHLDIEIIRLYGEGNSLVTIARIFDIGHSAVEYRLFINGVTLRSRSESSVGKPKSLAHRKEISRVRIDKGLAKGNRNPKWKGGITSEKELLRKSKEYKFWRKQVFERDNYTCKGCTDAVGGNLEAHHILSRSEFPHLTLVVSNGLTLCEKCHDKVHSKRSLLQARELLGSPERKDVGNQQPSLERGRFNDYVRASEEKI